MNKKQMDLIIEEWWNDVGGIPKHFKFETTLTCDTTDLYKLIKLVERRKDEKG